MARKRAHRISRLRRALAAGWAVWRRPLITIDDEDYVQLRIRIDRAERAEAEARVLEPQRDARRLVANRTEALTGIDRDAVIDYDRLPLTAEGDLHVEATTALVEVALWARRVDDCQEVTR